MPVSFINNASIAAAAGISTTKLGAGAVLQVVQGFTSTTTSSTNTWTDTTLSASITPTSSSSKILIIVSQNYSVVQTSVNSYGGLRILRGSTTIYSPSPEDSTGPYLSGAGIGNATVVAIYGIIAFTYLDSPATTSSTTYKTQQRSYNSAMTMTTQLTATTNGTSSILLLEVAA